MLSFLIETSSELGGAFGIALLGCVLAAAYHHALPFLLPADLAPEAALAAGQTIAGAAAAAQHLPAEEASKLMNASREAFMTAMHITCLATGVILLLASAATVVLLREKKTAVSTVA